MIIEYVRTAETPHRRVGALLACAVCMLAVLLLVFPNRADAIPAFARQTHQPCAACHIGGFGPQLTPFGRQFKLLGYTLKVGNDTKVPLSLMLVETYTQTQKAQTSPPANGFGTNDNTELEQASVFVAGRITENLGVLAQATYSQNGGLLGWDNSDLRYARSYNVDGHPAIWGLSLNNNPSVTDVFNTAPAWQFPYMAPDLAPGPPATPILMGGLAQQVVGLNAYTQINGALYLEAGAYRSLSPAFLRDVNADFNGRLSGATPYARVAYTWNLPTGNVEVGGFIFHAARGLVTTNAQGNVVAAGGPTDKFTDYGIDTSYQLLNGSNHILTVNGLYLSEQQQLDATYPAGGSSNLHDNLHALNVNASYWYENTWGVTLGAFADDGSKDLTLYGNNGSPNTNGGVVELNWNPFGQADSWAQPFLNVRFGLQYTWYTRYSGLVYNVDGMGRTAADNNTLFLYTWLAF
ncbi:MAG TPA: cytochrome C [Dyella sp.]|uniref:cytochrome C n=1 Tax=Dyella sp. TaxID=1869338 RepID=UPI002CA4FFB3|nr:cytochrome C [Dyella sp.]HTV86152.1 cytochrome C [Dyella sp.]